MSHAPGKSSPTMASATPTTISKGKSEMPGELPSIWVKSSPSKGTKIQLGGDSISSEEPVTAQSKEARTLTSTMMRLWLQSLKEGRVSEIKELISRGIDVNGVIYVNYDRYDDWHEKNRKQDTEVNGIERDQDELEKLLIETGNYEIEIPIHLVVNISLNVARVLLEAGADVDLACNDPHTNMYSGTALQRAAGICAGSQGFGMMWLLLSHGADVNSRPGPKGSALQCAAQNQDEGAVEIVRLLLGHNADVNSSAGPYGTALQCATQNQGGKALEIAELLVGHGAEVNAPPGIKGTALQSAAQNSGKKAVEIVQLLLSRGADINASPGRHGTALQSAAQNSGKKAVEIVQLLLSQGANVNASPGRHGTALQSATSNRGPEMLEVAELLVSHGADINAPPGPNGTALQSAVRNQSEAGLEVVKILLRHGADVNASRHIRRGTALQGAVLTRGYKMLEIVQLLLEHGADVHASYGNVGTALQSAIHFRRSERSEIVPLLLTHGANIDDLPNSRTMVEVAVRKNDTELLRILFLVGVKVNGNYDDPDSDNENDYDAVWAAADQNNTEMVRLLLGAGANPEGVLNKPPIVRAAWEGNLEIVKLLYSYGANIDAVDRSKGPAVVGAALSGHGHVSSWLLEHGADASDASKWETLLRNQGMKSLERWTPSPNNRFDELRLWEFATEPSSFERCEALWRKVDSICSSWKYTGPVWYWQVPDFIMGIVEDGKADKNLDREVILTTLLAPADLKNNKENVQCFRACTWTELIEEQLGRKFPDVAHFLDRLLGHVTEHLQELKSGDASMYIHKFPDGLMSNVWCTWDSVYINIVDGYGSRHRALHWGMDTVCKAFRAKDPEVMVTVSRGRWTLERFEVPPPTDATDDDCNTGKTYGIRPAMTLWYGNLELTATPYDCWQNLFELRRSRLVEVERLYHHASDVEEKRKNHNGKGLELSFPLMIDLTAVEFPLFVDGGVVFAGYNTALVPVQVEGNVAQFHLITNKELKGQINPHTVDLGPRLKTSDYEQFRNMRCFLGWCEVAQINLGTRGLPAKIDYSGSPEKGKSLQMDGFTAASQIGASAPLSAILGLEANFKYTSHRLQFTPFGGYCKLLRDTALELAIIYDAAKKRCWLAPKLSLLMHMSQAYALACPGSPQNRVPFVDSHSDAAELIQVLEPLGDTPVLGAETDGLRFRQLILGLNTNLLTTVAATQKSARKTLYGFEFMDVVNSPGRGTCMKSLSISCTEKWLHVVNDVDAVVVCSNIDNVITAVTSGNGPPIGPGNAQVCPTIPEGLDYLAMTIPCLTRLLHRKGVDYPSRTSSNGIQASAARFWDLDWNSFWRRLHLIKSTDGENNMDRLEQLLREAYLGIPIQKSKVKQALESSMPASGAVVFGGFIVEGKAKAG